MNRQLFRALYLSFCLKRRSVKGFIAVFLLLFLNACTDSKKAEFASNLDLFGSEIIIHRDSAITVTDTMLLSIKKADVMVGILRILPEEIVTGEDQFKILEYTVLDTTLNNIKIKHQTQSNSGHLLVYIGDEEKKLAIGTHRFSFQYKVKGALSFVSDKARLSWNITGRGPGFPITSVVSLVKLPNYVPRTQLLPALKNSYLLSEGKRSLAYNYDILKDGTIKYWTTKALKHNDNFIVDLSFPKGFIKPE